MRGFLFPGVRKPAGRGGDTLGTAGPVCRGDPVWSGGTRSAGGGGGEPRRRRGRSRQAAGLLTGPLLRRQLVGAGVSPAVPPLTSSDISPPPLPPQTPPPFPPLARVRNPNVDRNARIRLEWPSVGAAAAAGTSPSWCKTQHHTLNWKLGNAGLFWARCLPASLTFHTLSSRIAPVTHSRR